MSGFTYILKVIIYLHMPYLKAMSGSGFKNNFCISQLGQGLEG